MASSSCNLPKDESLCPLCLEVFNRPVTNPCGHTFCSHCLASYCEKVEGEVHCPVCEEPFQNISSLESQFKSLQVTETQTCSSDQQQVSAGSLNENVFPPVRQKPPPPPLEILVFRSWTPIDLSDAASMLPHPTKSAKAFAAAFLAFCRESRPTGDDIRRIMAQKLEASDLEKVSTELPNPDLRLSNPDWDSDDNAAYRNAIYRLVDACTRNFLRKVNLMRVHGCKQEPDESVSDYIDRVCDEVTEFSGYERPDGIEGTDKASCWEVLCCNVIVKGLQDDIAKVLQSLSFGSKETPRLHEVRRYAQYAQDKVVFEKKEEQTEERRRTATNICRSMDAIPLRSRLGKKVFPPHCTTQSVDKCLYCGHIGHWKRWCPIRRLNKRSPQESSIAAPAFTHT